MDKTEPWWIEEEQWCLRQPHIEWRDGQPWCIVCAKPAPKSHIISTRHEKAVEFTERHQADVEWCLGQPHIVRQEGQPWCPLCWKPAHRSHIVSRKHKNAVKYIDAEPEPAEAEQEQDPAAFSSNAPAPAASTSSVSDLHFRFAYDAGKHFGYMHSTDVRYDTGHDDGYEAGKGRGWTDGYAAGKGRGFADGKGHGLLIGYQYGLLGKANGKEAHKDDPQMLLADVGGDAGATGKAKGKEAHTGKGGADAQTGKNPVARQHGDIRQRHKSMVPERNRWQ